MDALAYRHIPPLVKKSDGYKDANRPLPKAVKYILSRRGAISPGDHLARNFFSNKKTFHGFRVGDIYAKSNGLSPFGVFTPRFGWIAKYRGTEAAHVLAENGSRILPITPAGAFGLRGIRIDADNYACGAQKPVLLHPFGLRPGLYLIPQISERSAVATIRSRG